MDRTPHLPLVLASASPRRRELLARAGVPFEVIPAHIPEPKCPGESPAEEVMRLAEQKALAVARRIGPKPQRLVLGSDTGVLLDGEMLGKPEDVEHATELLRRLAGRTHTVLTGVALVWSDTLEPLRLHVETEVTFHPLGDATIRDYVATGETMDKAGGYAAQGCGRTLIKEIRGSETNVIGLPLEETLLALRKAGFPLEPPDAG